MAPKKKKSRPVAKAVEEEEFQELDDIDAFHQDRHKVLLRGGDAFDGGRDDDDEEVLALPSDDSEEGSDVDDEREKPTKLKAKKKGRRDEDEDDDDSDDSYGQREIEEMEAQLASLKAKHKLGDEVEASESEEEEEGTKKVDTAWGKKRRGFYAEGEEEAAGESSEDENAMRKEEEEAALEMQRQQAEGMADADYGLDESFGAALVADERKREKKRKKRAKAGDVGALDLGNIALSKLGKGDVEVEQVQRDVSRLSKEQQLDLIAKESPELLDFLADFKENMALLNGQLYPLLERVRAQAMPGVAAEYVEAKYHLVVAYCTAIAFYLLLKAEGKSVKTHPVVDELVRLRAVMAKMAPLDDRLGGQIDKLLDAVDGAEGKDKKRAKAEVVSAKNGRESKEKKKEKKTKGGEASATAESRKVKAGSRPAHEKPLGESDSEDIERMMKEMGGEDMQFDFGDDDFGDSEMEEDAPAKGKKDQKRSKKGEENGAADAAKANGKKDGTDKKDKKDKKKPAKPAKERPIAGSAMEDFGDFGDLASADESETDILGGKKKKLAQRINEMENAGKKKVRIVGGDEDIPRRPSFAERAAKLPVRKGQNDDEDGDDFDDDFDGEEAPSGGKGKKRKRAREDEGDFDEDADLWDDGERSGPARKKSKQGKGEGTNYYDVVSNFKSQQRASHEARREGTRAATSLTADDSKDGKRGAGYKIIKNRGMTAHRNKLARNPRVKNRVKFEKTEQRRKGQVQPMKDKRPSYKGENTGIKANVTRSVHFK